MTYDKMQSTMSKVILLFDIDGTLLLSGGSGKECFERAAFELFQLEKCWGDYKPDGKTDPIIIEEIIETKLGRRLTSEENEAISSRYLEYFSQSVYESKNFRLMPGIEKLIPHLSENKSIFLGITTGNYKIAAEHKLQKAGLKDYFLFGGFACDSAIRPELTAIGFQRALEHIGEDIPQENVFVIGDTVYDIQAGRHIGAKTVGVATGSTSFERLESEKPDFCFRDFSNWENFLADISAKH